MSNIDQYVLHGNELSNPHTFETPFKQNYYLNNDEIIDNPNIEFYCDQFGLDAIDYFKQCFKSKMTSDKRRMIHYMYMNHPQLLTLWLGFPIKPISTRDYYKNPNNDIHNMVFFEDELFYFYENFIERKFKSLFHSRYSEIINFNHSLLNRIHDIRPYIHYIRFELGSLKSKWPQTFNKEKDIDNYDYSEIEFYILLKWNFSIIFEIDSANINYLKLDPTFRENYWNKLDEGYTNNLEFLERDRYMFL